MIYIGLLEASGLGVAQQNKTVTIHANAPALGNSYHEILATWQTPMRLAGRDLHLHSQRSNKTLGRQVYWGILPFEVTILDEMRPYIMVQAVIRQVPLQISALYRNTSLAVSPFFR